MLPLVYQDVINLSVRLSTMDVETLAQFTALNSISITNLLHTLNR
jgi:hypothetical protein